MSLGSEYLEQGLGAHTTVIIIRNHQNSIGNYYGPYITASALMLRSFALSEMPA